MSGPQQPQRSWPPSGAMRVRKWDELPFQLVVDILREFYLLDVIIDIRADGASRDETITFSCILSIV